MQAFRPNFSLFLGLSLVSFLVLSTAACVLHSAFSCLYFGFIFNADVYNRTMF